MINTTKNRRGEITTQQIVLLIILIVSFAVILFFLVRLNLGSTSDTEVCHNSVVSRSSGVIPTESIPLNCKTSYICLSKDGTCEKMTSPKIEKVKTKEEVYSILAEDMSECWWQFGEGKLNYISSQFTSDLYCSICYQLAFDDSIDFFENNEINKNEFYVYLSSTNVSGKDITYLDYLVGLTSSQTIESTLTSQNANFGKMSLDKQYYIMMGIFSKVGVVGWIAAGAATTGIVASVILSGGLSIPILIAAGGGAIAGGVGGYFLGTAFSGDSGHQYLSPTIIEANSKDFNSLNCSSINTLA